MDAVFLRILNLSIPASMIIIAVIILRAVFSKSPKWIRYILWATVALRLSVPVSFESSFSLVPNAQKIDSTSQSSTTYITQSAVENTQIEVSGKLELMDILSYIWIAGVVIFALYMVISYIRVKLQVRESVNLKDNIYICDYVSSPFVLGFVNPKIYLNSAMSEGDAQYIIAHEKTHIKHHDYIWKPFGFLLLCVYWFNPLCYIAYFLFVKDIELFCDESVIKTLSSKGKKEYSTVLLECGLSSKAMSRCPLAFSESNLKHRIKSVLKYKKPPMLLVVTSVTVCSIVLMMFMSNPVSTQAKEIEEIAPTQAVVETQVATEPLTEPPTEPPTEKPTEKPTEAPTEPPTEAEYVEQYYDYSYDDSYDYSSDYDDSYSEDSNLAQQIPFDEYYQKVIDEEIEKNRQAMARNNTDYSPSDSMNSFNNSNSTGNDVIVWDYGSNPQGSQTSGVQRADGWLTGLD